MTIKKRTAAGLTAATPQTLTPAAVGLGAKYGRLLGFTARNYASSAKAGAGTDTAIRVKIVDNASRVVYLDAADRDYATAAVHVVPSLDDTATGLSYTATDATGAARGVAESGGDMFMESPIVVSIVNGGTATDYVQVDVYVEI